MPHAHILIVLEKNDKPHTPDIIDKLVSAEIPNSELFPRLHKIVMQNQIHGPCGVLNPNSSCMIDNSCTKDFPKAFQLITNPNVNGYPLYKSTGGKTYKLGKFFNSWI